MDLLLIPLLSFASFSALTVLFASTVAVAIWAARSFFRAIFGFPQALRDLRTRPRDRRVIRAELNLLKRAGA